MAFIKVCSTKNDIKDWAHLSYMSVFTRFPKKLPLHPHIQKKLDYFYEHRKIPHLIFHGPSGTGKRTIVYDFLNRIYNADKYKLKTNVMMVNCAHGKGIKFIREELKFFAKTNIQSNSGILFKSIILLNADSLTIDAQSALRRCIELFSHNTRFFIIVENKHKLLNPILSRFCEIYVPEYLVDGKIVNLHTYLLEETYPDSKIDIMRREWLRQRLDGVINGSEWSHSDFIDLSTELYERGYSAANIVDFISNSDQFAPELSANIQLCFQKVKSEFRHEKMLMFYILDYIFLRPNKELKYIGFI